MNNQELLDAIATAFPAPPIAPAVFADSTGLWRAYIKDKSFESASTGKTWRTLPPALVDDHGSALGYMNLEAFVAVLPAYLTALVTGTQSELPALVIGELTRKDAFRDTFDARVARMTVQQRSVIALVLESFARTDRFSRLYGAKIDEALASWREVVRR